MIDIGWLVLVLLVTAYTLIVVLLYRAGHIGKDKPLTLFGPALMLKTVRGRATLDAIARRSRRFWNAYGDLGIILSLVAMAGMVILLLWEAVLVVGLPSSAAPQPAEALALPGINPFIPIGYGLVALIVGVVLHEYSHGILARANNVKVKSLGVLWLVIPIGAFVEQDDEEMMKAPARSRDRIAAAGVMANFALALVFFLILSMVVSTSLHPKADGVGVYAVIAGTPAHNASLAPGDIITSVNGTATPNTVDLRSALGATHPGQSVLVSWYSQADSRVVSANVTLGEASAFIPGLTGNASKAAFFGIEEYVLPPQVLTSVLTNPFGNGAQQAGLTGGGTASTPFLFLALPFVSLEPLQGAPAAFYTVSGPFAFLGVNGVLVLTNMAYWLAWMNVLLGLSNALPAVPLDGGFLFRDAMTKVVRKARSSWPEARLEGVVSRLSLLATLAIFALILWQFVGPRL